MKINLGKGLLRLYLVLWILWVIVILDYNHKALAPHVGITYWTVEDFDLRAKVDKETCNKKTTLPNDDICTLLKHSRPIAPFDYPSNEEIEKAPRDFFDLGIVVPFILLFIFTGIYMALKWIFKGFKK
jgi:hypothetical protein